jgi:UDP-N-acetyl-D-glucosamine dehydrogenase
MKIKNKSAVVGVVGLGYVGLPLAVAFSKNYEVIGYDKNKDKINLLKQNRCYIEDVQDSEINLEKFNPTTNLEELKKCDFIIITVPTPLKDDKSPDLSYIKMAAEEIGRILKKGQFIILKSTTFPGTTEDYLIPTIEKKCNLNSIVDFGIAYSPERVDPGNKKYKIENTPNVVGGLTPRIYRNLCIAL